MCLSVWNRSPQAYRELCASGMLALPSGRLLRYYKNSIKQNAGLNKEVFELMRNEATKWKVPKCGYRGGIILDEMSIQEDIQLKQENGLMKLVGFTDIGEEDNAMRALKTGNDLLSTFQYIYNPTRVVVSLQGLLLEISLVQRDQLRLEGYFSMW